jgi:hypothetical protein
MAIVFNGDSRENVLEAGVYNYVEKYVRTKGNAKDGLYCYNFCLNTDPFEYQPSGAINLSKFKTIEIELSTIIPPFDINSTSSTICDSAGNVIGVTNKEKLYTHTFDLFFIEERYNLLRFIGGSAGLVYAR